MDADEFRLQRPRADRLDRRLRRGRRALPGRRRRRTRRRAGPAARRTRRPRRSRGTPCSPTSTQIIVPGIVALAAPELLRLLPVEHVVPVDPRRAAGGRARRAGHELGDVAGVHRARDADARLDGRAARPARPLPHRRAPTGGGVIQGSASEATLRGHPGGALAGHRRGGQRTTATRRASSPTPRRRPTRSIEKGLRIAGIGTDRLRIVPHDDAASRCGPTTLAALVAADVAAGLVPFFVCAAARHDVVDGVRPDRRDRRRSASEHGIWLHVDAAMSGIAALAPELRWVNDGLERRRQLLHEPAQVDGRQLRLRPVLDRRPRRAARGAVASCPSTCARRPPRRGAAIDYRDWQIPLGRRFRALKLWLTLRLDGVGVDPGR